MATMSSSSASSTIKADTKISNDLVVLKEKMDLLETMLNPPDAASPKPSVKTDGAVRSVVGYLDACGPRMIELVTACSAKEGVVSEAVFGEILAQNDRLQNLLTEFDTRLLTETSVSTTVAASSSAAAGAEASTAAGDLLTEHFGDLLLGNEDPFAEAHGSSNKAGAKTTGETSEDFDDTFFATAPASVPPASAPPASAPLAPSAPPAVKDPFDDFFAERTDQH